jgi:hypothetical protein
MRALVELAPDGQILNSHTFVVYEALTQLGYDIDFFKEIHMAKTTRDCLVVGTVRSVRTAVRMLGYAMPTPLDYPNELIHLLGRRVWSSTMKNARESSNWPVFVKPSLSHKLFQGYVINDFKDLLKTVDVDDDVSVYMSGVLHFISEYRVFVHKAKIIGMRHYLGDWGVFPDTEIIKGAVASFTDGPIAYALDFGITEDGRTLLVEANDFFALGSYGLPGIDYCHALVDRWLQMVGEPCSN